jgi:SAM-dependent methyltransferase
MVQQQPSFARRLFSYVRYVTRYALHVPGFTWKPLDDIFTQIHRRNLWGNEESRSGVGSTHEFTEPLRRELPGLLRELSVRTLLDVGCGDFHWMNEVPLDGIDYIGAEIVDELVAELRQRYERPGRRFLCLDVSRDDLPRADLVLCRHCLIHLSNRNALRVLENIERSGARYLLATTFPSVKRNGNIVNGSWRPTNLERPPFGLPPPLRLISDYREFYGGYFTGRYSDISVGLWDLAALA